MRHEPNLRVDSYRVNLSGYESKAGMNWGAFQVGPLRIISSGLTTDNPDAAGWEHVSVSCSNRCPTWAEMDKIKKLFWRDDETVIQFHPRENAKINFHLFCLHLWKHADQEFELPPIILV